MSIILTARLDHQCIDLSILDVERDILKCDGPYKGCSFVIAVNIH